MNARNTSIAKSRLGEMRFPPRPPEPPGEVKKYFLPVEEIIKKFGPPRRPLRRNYDGHIDYQTIVAAMRTTCGPAEAAELLGIKPETLKWYIRKYQLPYTYGLAYRKKGVDEEMKIAGVNAEITGESELPENVTNIGPDAGAATPGNHDMQPAESPGQVKENQASRPGTKKTRLEIAREKLSKSEYIWLRAQGKTDRDIIRQFGMHTATFYKLKGEWGLTGQSQTAEKISEKTAPPPADGITIAQALERRVELNADIESWEALRKVAVDAGESARVVKTIESQINICRQTLERIKNVFESTVVNL
jgi:DNA-binding CsgD family transcriptional regulator